MARPSRYSAELALSILERLADGEGLRSICRDEAMPGRTTVQRWLLQPGDEFEEFRGRYARARELQADAFFEDCIEIADDASHDWIERTRSGSTSVFVDHEHIQRARLRVDTRKWAAGRIAPWKYGDKVQVDQTVRGHVEHAPQHDHVLEADPTKLAEILQILARFEGDDDDDEAGDAQDGGFAAADGGPSPI